MIKNTNPKYFVYHVFLYITSKPIKKMTIYLQYVITSKKLQETHTKLSQSFNVVLYSTILTKIFTYNNKVKSLVIRSSLSLKQKNPLYVYIYALPYRSDTN